ncbi:hypothetical protein QBC34DRAFT_454677, partial [Podospora aff. communis PSN243]
KVKCDFKQPCSRCAGKKRACAYGSEPGKTAGNLEIVTPFPVNAAANTSKDTSVVGDAALQLTATGLVPSNTLADCLPFELQGAEDSTFVRIFPPSTLLPGPFGASLVPYPRRQISPGCRQLIISTVRSFPRMMTRLDNLPPFIHQHGCQLHFGLPLMSEVVPVFSPEAGGPLRPLAACMRLAQVFVSQAPDAAGLLWDGVDSEHRRIVSEMADFSPGETLASLQAMIVYTIMRLMDSGISYFIVNRDLLKTNRDLAAHFLRLSPGPFSSPHARLCRPTWEEWIFEETRRRIVAICFLLDLVAGSADICELLADPYAIALPSSKMLWQARDAAIWEREYAVEWEQLTTNQARVDTLGDLALAKGVGNGGSGAQGRLAGLFADALDNWHAGLDGLGMLIAAVIADG